jgi:quercetin dioxygenase-like cupin family protein
MAGNNHQSAEIVLPAGNLNETVSFFSDELGFQLESIYPADNPVEAILYGFGLRIRFIDNDTIPPGSISITGDKSQTLTAPNGTVIQYNESNDSYFLPEGNQSIQYSRLNEGQWKIGRAGMEYRDLIPDRYGGRFIASHIRIKEAGPVSDYVHFHKVQFQMIFCYKGWARVVYEDQGEPFIFQAGDCVLQPPEIRHRVLENSDGFEVVEISSPASHMTCTDPELALPTDETLPDKDYNGQNFVHHISKKAEWLPWRHPGFEKRGFGFSLVTNGLAHVQVVKSQRTNNGFMERRDTEFHFIFMLQGELAIKIDGHEKHHLNKGDSITIPDGTECSINICQKESEFLEILFSKNV